ncbi:hypothetical protein TD95_003708 [Thielaviopsis punctulata]|uniref:ML-like domain-containing protein n=1 Tax=Thielaviopsis punctulata TaxID=72032 RepID=A0A0F4ZF15_9PEZI|nr:hypothetical protein TD95_003708 [Thielaviopsis punctulata]
MVAARALFTAATALFAGSALADNILHTVGFTTCPGTDDSVVVKNSAISFNQNQRTVDFNLIGVSAKQQNVTATISVTAYGRNIYTKSFDPCSSGTYVDQLCPVPSGTFTAQGVQVVPESVTNMIPSIAFQIPDIAAMARLELNSTTSSDSMVACIQSQVTNDKTANVAAVSWVAAGIAGAALAVSGLTAVSAAAGGAAAGGTASGAAAGAATPAPSFVQVFGWMQGMAMNGMLSVSYPPIYRSFTQNFAFTTGLVGWDGLQLSIDSFRSKTGGNLTADSFEKLRNTTLVFPDGSESKPSSSFLKRAVSLYAREVSASSSNSTSLLQGAENSFESTVSGIRAFVEKISVPQSNTFMTILLVVSIVIASIVVGILLVKVILEAWTLFGSPPQSLSSFRKHYWRSIARSVTTLIMLLYGVWVLYCVFQFTRGDSWAAKLLAGITLAIFSSVLAFFSFKIWSIVQQLKKTDGDASALFQNKELWAKYSLFYESYRTSYWWIFVPTIIYAFAKGVTLAAMDGKGRAQTAVQLVVEAAMLAVLVYYKPYERKSGNVINIFIQVVRLLSVVCILVFVEEFGISQTTQTVTGVVLIVIQSVLTGLLAILIVWNAVNGLFRVNPHKKRREDAEKELMFRDEDALTPLGPSFFQDTKTQSTTFAVSSMKTDTDKSSLSSSYTGREAYLDNNYSYSQPSSPESPKRGDRASLVGNAAPLGGRPRGDSVGP